MAYGIGRSGFNLGGATNRQKRQVRAELYISGDLAKTFFGLLKNQKAEIESELGYPLEWEELPDARDCRIACYLNEVDLADKAEWPKQHEWLAKRLNELHRAFSPRVRALEAG
jgi:hypothetical protein